jgi:long-chain fatty acid transport protein
VTRHLALAGALLGLSSIALDAEASPLLDLAGGSDGLGAMQAGTVEGGASAAYFNPALLVEAPSGLTIGILTLSEQMGISLDGRPGTQYAVPDGVANATHANGSALGNVPLPTGLLQNGRAATALSSAVAAHPRQGAGTGHQTFVYETVGFVARLFDDRLALGFHGIVPDGDFTNLNAFYSDEREQYFSNSLHPELYADRMTSLSIAFGAGWRVSDTFSIGLGASLSLKAGVGAPTFVANAGALQDLLIDTSAKVNTSLAPNLGISWKPTSRWRVSGTVHAPEKVELGVNFTFLLPTGLEQGSAFTLVYDYMPWQFGAGTEYDLVKTENDTLTVAGTAVYGRWSDYLDRHGQAPVAAYGWYDTITPTAGLRYRHHRVGTLLDVQYKPSPVPAQTGRTNYVDNDRAGLTAGVDYAFEVLHTAMRVGAQAQACWLIPRHQSKLPTANSPDGRDHYPSLVADELPDDSQVAGNPLAGSQGLQTNNPGWPGFGSEGAIVGGGVYASVTW